MKLQYVLARNDSFVIRRVGELGASFGALARLLLGYWIVLFDGFLLGQ